MVTASRIVTSSVVGLGPGPWGLSDVWGLGLALGLVWFGLDLGPLMSTNVAFPKLAVEPICLWLPLLLYNVYNILVLAAAYRLPGIIK